MQPQFESRRRILRIALGSVLAGLGPLVRAQGTAPLKMAVHPYNSTLSLIATHQPLQRHLAAALGRPVEFYTAANFDAFVAALMAGEYDIAISPPHFAVLAMERGYAALVHYVMNIEPLLIVRAETSFRQAPDFRGRTIAMADKSAFIRIAMTKWLADNGLVAGRDYTVLERPTHAASVTAVALGEADAGLATLTAVMQMPMDVQRQLRSLGIGERFPHLFTLANRRLGDEEVKRIKAALLDFPKQPEGRKFMADTGFLGYEEISGAELARLKPYVDLYQRSTGAR